MSQQERRWVGIFGHGHMYEIGHTIEKYEVISPRCRDASIIDFACPNQTFHSCSARSLNSRPLLHVRASPFSFLLLAFLPNPATIAFGERLIFSDRHKAAESMCQEYACRSADHDTPT